MSTDSSVTDEMVDAACSAYENHRLLTPDGKSMRAALEAALSHQAPSVAVVELEKLDRWDVFAECGNNGSGYVERQVYDDGEFIRYDDLRNLIKEAGRDE
jgi:hypothetical protein